ncbi:MAG: hypothetical protein M3R00_01290 [Pseudomonadota bacterium]|nr:hypothetical protein [Pseudomonadota bacterium]
MSKEGRKIFEQYKSLLTKKKKDFQSICAKNVSGYHDLILEKLNAALNGNELNAEEITKLENELRKMYCTATEQGWESDKETLAYNEEIRKKKIIDIINARRMKLKMVESCYSKPLDDQIIEKNNAIIDEETHYAVELQTVCFLYKMHEQYNPYERYLQTISAQFKDQEFTHHFFNKIKELEGYKDKNVSLLEINDLVAYQDTFDRLFVMLEERLKNQMARLCPSNLTPCFQTITYIIKKYLRYDLNSNNDDDSNVRGIIALHKAIETKLNEFATSQHENLETMIRLAAQSTNYDLAEKCLTILNPMGLEKAIKWADFVCLTLLSLSDKTDEHKQTETIRALEHALHALSKEDATMRLYFYECLFKALQNRNPVPFFVDLQGLVLLLRTAEDSKNPQRSTLYWTGYYLPEGMYEIACIIKAPNDILNTLKMFIKGLEVDQATSAASWVHAKLLLVKATIVKKVADCANVKDITRFHNVTLAWLEQYQERFDVSRQPPQPTPTSPRLIPAHDDNSKALLAADVLHRMYK